MTTRERLLRFELGGTGVSGPGFIDADILLGWLQCYSNAYNARICFAHGWRNQPKTVRFSALDQAHADRIAENCRYHFYGDKLGNVLAYLVETRK